VGTRWARGQNLYSGWERGITLVPASLVIRIPQPTASGSRRSPSQFERKLRPLPLVDTPDWHRIDLVMERLATVTRNNNNVVGKIVWRYRYTGRI